MKISLLIYVSITLFFITGCNGKRNKEASQMENDTVSTIKQECYIAIYEKDTAYLNIKRLERSKVEGNLLIQYWNNPKNEGKIAGQFKGDTLFADYSYTVGTLKGRINKNPLAFLVKNDSLIIGIGEIDTKMGRSYFKPGVPINFDRGRFRFTRTECID